ncbi:MAG: 3-oxo-tetronate kinase [Pseudomonadota bacterium]
MTLLFGALADDLTGGMELAAMLVAQGVRCGFVTDPAAVDSLDADLEALVIAQKTRVVPAAEAVAAFRRGAEALRSRGARQLFFKYCATFDSTDDGNIGPCADVLREMTGSRLTAFCPSFPEAGRRGFQGHLFSDHMLISESPKRFDPLTPMLDPSLVRTLQRQTATRVGLIPQQVVHAGPAALRAHARALEDAGIGFAIADAAEPSDLAALAELTWDWPLMTGNSSICAYYPALWRQHGWLASESAVAQVAQLPAVDGPGVVLAGSCADRSIAQLHAFARDRPVHWIDVERALDGADVVADALDWSLQKLQSGPVAIATSAQADVIERIQVRVGKHEAAGIAEDILGRLARRLRDAGVTRFIVSGGETSGAVLAHLGIDRLQVGPYAGPGIARAVAHDGKSQIALCLKSGKLGPEDMLLPMLQSMQGN